MHSARNVAILPDNDEPGRKHAEQVANALHGIAASVKIVEPPGLPPKGDVSDWLDAGGSAEALLAMVAEAPEWAPGEAAAEEATPVPQDEAELSLWRPEARTDAANVLRFERRFGADVRYCGPATAG